MKYDINSGNGFVYLIDALLFYEKTQVVRSIFKYTFCLSSLYTKDSLFWILNWKKRETEKKEKKQQMTLNFHWKN